MQNDRSARDSGIGETPGAKSADDARQVAMPGWRNPPAVRRSIAISAAFVEERFLHRPGEQPGGKRLTNHGRRLGDLEPKPELWAALDGGWKLTEILTDFYNHVYEDPRLAPFFEGTTKQRAIEKQYSFLHDKFTGSATYFGDRPRNAHHWMVISDELFDHREALMESCLRRAGLAEHLVAEWLATEEVFRKQIVKAAPVPRKIRGVALPLDGHEQLELAIGCLCDGCAQPMNPGDAVQYHVRTGRTYCARCLPRCAVAPDGPGDGSRQIKEHAP